jgi:ferric-dicitrate binding protein FerR (iron transport regulator)
MNKNVRDLIFQAIDRTISEQDFHRLQDAIEENEEVRAEYLRAVGLCESLGEIATEPPAPTARIPMADDKPATPDASVTRSAQPWSTPPARQFAIVATLLILVGGAAFWLGQTSSSHRPDQNAISETPIDETQETQIAGHATLRRAVDLKWSAGMTRRREGDVLPDGKLSFDKGIAEIDFFCGAILIVEGPARLDIESDWSVRVDYGRLRANVPPAARGFVVKAADAEIVDLGTEFALNVGDKNAWVEVIDGEVELRGGKHGGKHLVTGQGQSLKGTGPEENTFDGLSTETDLRRRHESVESLRFAQWKRYSDQVKTDRRLIALFPVAKGQAGRTLGNASPAGSQRDGLLIGPVERTTGRFGSASAGLRFERPGARVRTLIDGEFQAYTFACWVRIDNLNHRYNALFMADGFENGEPHWQIRDDGRMMISVMVDDTQEIRHYSKLEREVVQAAGLQRNYISEPFWDLSKSGQWFHLVAVYDPIARRVKQYANGRLIGDEPIIDKFFISKLRVGPAEIGNWGQPFRKTPEFAIRNLDGIIDELAIFNAALEGDEIQLMCDQGKPTGY